MINLTNLVMVAVWTKLYVNKKFRFVQIYRKPLNEAMKYRIKLGNPHVASITLFSYPLLSCVCYQFAISRFSVEISNQYIPKC